MKTSAPGTPKERSSFALYGRTDHRSKMVEQSAYRPLPADYSMQRIRVGVGRIGRAIHHQVNRAVPSEIAGIRIPWFRLFLAALIVYILTFKDLQFSLDMRAPLYPDREEPASAAIHQRSGLGLGSFVSRPAQHPHGLNPEDVKVHISRFSQAAMTERDRYGIPTSIKLAQAILESQAGKLPEAEQYHNHFGMPLSGSVYENAWANWRAHSELLKRDFPELFRQGNSYRKWAVWLQQLGYSSDKNYAKRLVSIVEAFGLHKLDED